MNGEKQMLSEYEREVCLIEQLNKAEISRREKRKRSKRETEIQRKTAGGRKNSPVQTVGSKVDPYEVQKQNKRRADKCLLPPLITSAQHTNETTFNDDNKDEQTIALKVMFKNTLHLT